MPVSRRVLLSVFTFLLAAAARPSPPPTGTTLGDSSRRDLVGGIVGGVADLLDLNTTCNAIAKAVSSASEVYYPGTLNYIADNNHWASSSSDTSCCSVEPGSSEDISTILKILGETRTPFAVKGGGHASNPGFSSTTGVQIAMTRFDAVTYDAAAGTAKVGAGLVWDDVYEALEPLDVNVVGGRVTGVGVAGFTLGGGYSWLSNQHGLTIDTVVAFDIVLPDGTVNVVTESSDPDLFFALKGSGNNFGIVTAFTLKTFPQGQCWGGLITITGDHFDEVVAATARFSANVTDPKAAIITTMNSVAGAPGVSQLLFYDGPTPPPGTFDDFLAIPHFTSDVGTRSFLDVVKASPSDATSGQRGVFNTVSTTSYSVDFLKAVVNQTVYWGSALTLASATFISFDIEPFLPTALTQAPVSSSAYPPTRTRYLPTNLYFAWTSPLSDDIIFDAIRESKRVLQDKAVELAETDADASVYGNYAIFGTPMEEIYGDNMPRLTALKAQYDPQNVMGLAGGFKL